MSTVALTSTPRPWQPHTSLVGQPLERRRSAPDIKDGTSLARWGPQASRISPGRRLGGRVRISLDLLAAWAPARGDDEVGEGTEADEQ